MSSSIWLKSGIYDPSKRFEFTNITKEPFTFYWAQSPITVKAGEKIELPHHLAVLATTALVDKVMGAEIKAEEDVVKADTKNPMYRSPRGISMGVPAAREPYENKICRELAPNESKITESQMGIIRSELKESIEADMKATKSPRIEKISIPAKEFEEINIPSKK